MTSVTDSGCAHGLHTGPGSCAADSDPQAVLRIISRQSFRTAGLAMCVTFERATGCTSTP